MTVLKSADGTLRDPKTLEIYAHWFDVDGIEYYVPYKKYHDNKYYSFSVIPLPKGDPIEL